jgi:anaerobic magnesium-protoporphyrin IX monomethyl ester cyclase
MFEPGSKVLLTHSYFLQYDPKQLQWNKPYPPLGTLQAAAVLRQAGHKVHFFDTMFESDPAGIRSSLEEIRPDYLIIYDDGFNYLTKMCLTNMRHACWKMIALAKSAGSQVIVCSSDSTDHYEKYLDSGADFVVLGEGEMTLTNLLAANGGYREIPGIVFREGDKTIRTSPRPVMQDLDSLPLPTWDLVDVQPYRERWEKNWGYFSLNIATTRGCPYKCNWCAKPIYGNSYKMRSPRHVLDEISMLMDIHPFEHIWFCDDIFGLKRSWVVEFAELVEGAGLSFRYKIQSRADLLVKPQYVEALAASGCKEAWMGVESGSQKILDAMEKGITIDQVRQARKILSAHDIRACFFIQFGYPGEEMEDIRMTIDLIKELLPDDIGISVSYPLPGTKFYDMVRDSMYTKENWEDSDDLDMMFENRYPRNFYKKLHRHVHNVHRRELAIRQLKRLSTFNFSPKKALSFFYYAPAAFVSKNRLNYASL